ncbi:hypothetical protein [Gordonia alkanivorans]|uniref:hypothetical protein n=1 Tax=Gordonia alkanivorans TaxID=84096 RepID=UPI0024B82D73|nr:hypothetical protein [Gordonia alkanivorans]MDJ0010153.1 hypothetical protein [Gordonia alkanivorans]MDJ0495657.1 hypothetical protein [Gordonia alkanivorans]
MMPDPKRMDPLVRYIYKKTGQRYTQEEIAEDILDIRRGTYLLRLKSEFRADELITIAKHFHDDYGMTVEDILVQFGKATREQIRGSCTPTIIADVMRDVLNEYMQPIEKGDTDA